MRKETVFLYLFLIFDLLVVFVLMDVMYQNKTTAPVPELEPQVEELTLIEYEEADPFYKKRGITQALFQHLPKIEVKPVKTVVNSSTRTIQ